MQWETYVFEDIADGKSRTSKYRVLQHTRTSKYRVLEHRFLQHERPRRILPLSLRWVAILRSRKKIVFMVCYSNITQKICSYVVRTFPFAVTIKFLSYKQRNRKIWTQFSRSLSDSGWFEAQPLATKPAEWCRVTNTFKRKLLVANQTLQPTSDLNKHTCYKVKKNIKTWSKEGRSSEPILPLILYWIQQKTGSLSFPLSLSELRGQCTDKTLHNHAQ